VNKQMFKQFTECVRATLAESAGTPPEPGEPSATRDRTEKPAELPTTPPGQPAWSSVLATPTSGSIVPLTPPTARPQSDAPVSAQPVRLIPVLLRALMDYVGGVFSRLFGRKPKA